MKTMTSQHTENEMFFSPHFDPASGFISIADMNRTEQRQGPVRVAAYIRVSTDSEDQENSYETQNNYFSELLSVRDDWEYAGVYADYGLSGTSNRNRTGYKRLLRHCAEGKIDRIICKSISRFARNTSDFMIALNILHENNVTIAFEKEGLDTANPTSEFILTTLAAIAQEESRSISTNIRWGQNKRFPKGNVRNYDLYGYRYTGKGIVTGSGYCLREIEIVPEEAEIVRLIFNRVLEGTSFTDVARQLNRTGAPEKRTRFGRKRQEHYEKGQLYDNLEPGWTSEQIREILANERYCGDVRIQKTYTESYLTHKSRKNDGALPQYYVKDHHPAIVSRELFDAAQQILKNNAARCGKEDQAYSHHAFSKRIVCGHCGRFYHVRNSRSYPIWYCPSTRDNGRRICTSEKVYEEQIVRMVRRAIIDRYGLLMEDVIDDVKVTDILSGRFEGDNAQALHKNANTFVRRMQARLRNIQRLDCMERDRGMLKRQVAAVEASMEESAIRICGLESELESMDARKRLFGDLTVKDEDIRAVTAALDAEQIRYSNDEIEKRSLEERLDYLEHYWSEVEADYAEREKAIAWMNELPKGKAGTIAFLNGLTDSHVKAFALSITIYDPLHCTVHWFDDTKTDVTMYSNIEDHRCTAAWFDGRQMREGRERYRGTSRKG